MILSPEAEIAQFLRRLKYILFAGLIGWVGGETIVNDNLLHGYTMAHPWLHYAAAAAGAVLVVGLGKFMQALRTQDGTGARALEFTILTATRSGETRGAKWSEIDMEAGVWWECIDA